MTDKKAQEKPDDTEINRLLAESEDLPEALGTIADKYGAQVTNNEPRWLDGQYLRHVGDFMRDVKSAFERFPLPVTDDQVEAACEGFYDAQDGLSRWDGMRAVSEDWADKYRVRIRIALEAERKIR